MRSIWSVPTHHMLFASIIYEPLTLTLCFHVLLTMQNNQKASKYKKYLIAGPEKAENVLRCLKGRAPSTLISSLECLAKKTQWPGIVPQFFRAPN